MMFGIGIDVLKVDRIERVFEKHGERFVDHLLMPEVRAQLDRTARPVRFLAMRFATKETLATGMGPVLAHAVWIRDVGVIQNPCGTPARVYCERGAMVPDRIAAAAGPV